MSKLNSIILLFLLSLSSQGQILRKSNLVIPVAAAGGGGGGSSVSDSFTRANETPLAGNWTRVTDESGTLNLASNQLGIGTDSDTTYYYTGTWSADQSSEVAATAGVSNAGSGPGVAVRCSTSARTYYRFVVDVSGNYEVGKMVAGSFTSLRTGTVTYSAGALIKLSIAGSTLTLFYNGAQVGATISDGDIASGNPGVSYSSSNSGTTMDSWTGTQ